jgi:hypothetical protein
MATSTPLSAIQVAALRKADRVAFIHHGQDSMIRAVKDIPATEAQPFAADAVNEIEVGSRWDDYGSPHLSAWDVAEYRGFEMVYNWTESVWRTIAGLLKKGDLLSLEWRRDAATTEALKAVGMHGDELRLIVTRPGHKPMIFLLSSKVCADSMARMITGVHAKTPKTYSLA